MKTIDAPTGPTQDGQPNAGPHTGPRGGGRGPARLWLVAVGLVIAGLVFGAWRFAQPAAPNGSPAGASPANSLSATATPTPGAPTQASSGYSTLGQLQSPGDAIVATHRIDRANAWALDLTTVQTGQSAPTPAAATGAAATGPASQSFRLKMTGDAGATWHDATPSPAAFTQPWVEFVDPDHGWFIPATSADGKLGGRIWRTVDGGRTWQASSLPAGRTDVGARTSFVSPSTGYMLLRAAGAAASAAQVLYRTTDGGASWTDVAAVSVAEVAYGQRPDFGPPPLFSTEMDGFGVDLFDFIQTHDGGLHWSVVALPEGVAPILTDVRVFGTQAVAMGWQSNGVGAEVQPVRAAVYTSGDAGRTWLQAYAGQEYLMDAGAWTIIDTGTWLWLRGDRPLAQITYDAGRTWAEYAVDFPAGRVPMAVSFVSATDGWAILETRPVPCPPKGCLQPEATPSGLLAATTDGGRTWQLMGPTDGSAS